MSLPNTTREYRLLEGSKLNQSQSVIPALKSHEVLLKVHAVSLQFRDLMIFKGQYPRPTKENLVPCSDMAGSVVAVGNGVQTWGAGDRVCVNFATDHIAGDSSPAIMATALGGNIDGTLREYMVVPAHALVAVPAQLSFEEASTLPCAALTAYNALHGPSPVKAGDTVLVIGTGGVSIFGLQFARAAGAQVIALSSSQEKMDKARALGAHHVINYREVENWEEEVLKITDGRGVDHILEVGGQGTLNHSVGAVRFGGYIHMIGFVAGKADVSQIPLQLLSKGAFLRGILIGSVHQFRDMNRLIDINGLRPVVDRVFGFEQVHEAYGYLESQKHVGKVVIKIA